MNDLNRKWYEAKDIKKLLNISASELFHWGRTWQLVSPDIKAKSRGGRDKYSFKNLVILSLIKVLNRNRIELRAIKIILEKISSIKHAKYPRKRFDIWDLYKKERDYFKKAGLFLFISVPLEMEKREVECDILESNEIRKILELMSKNKEGSKELGGLILIDLLTLIESLEEKSGEKV